jgi:hypothetical protein
VIFNHFGTTATFSGAVVANAITATTAGSSILSLNNTNYDEIQIQSKTDFNATVKLTNITQAVDYLSFRRDGTRAYLGLDSSAILWRTTMPNTGTFTAGDRVFKTNPAEEGGAGSKYIITGWIRLTTGTDNTLNTDWFEMRTLTGN